MRDGKNDEKYRSKKQYKTHTGRYVHVRTQLEIVTSVKETGFTTRRMVDKRRNKTVQSRDEVSKEVGGG